jgi:DNA modification methylase
VNEYLCHDARNIERILEPESVQLTITSPPYFDTKDYEGSERQIGWRQTFEDYLADIEVVFKKLYEATRTDGSLWIVVDTYRREGGLKLLPLRIMDTLEEVGWIPQDVILWDKVKNLPYSRRGQFRDNFEYILFLSKGSKFKYYIDRIRELHNLKKWWVKYPERYHPKGKAPSNIWRINIPNQGAWSNSSIQHLCPFPPRLVERIIQLSTDEDDLIFDPFAGSGVVLAQANCMNRKFVGCDINKKYRARFISKVLPEMEAIWERRSSELEETERQRRVFEDTILALRKLKFTKILIGKLLTEFGDDVSSLVITISRRGRNERFQIKALIGESYAEIIQEIRQYLRRQSSLSPLSSYGLKPSIRAEISRHPDILARIKRNDFFAYSNGRFFDCLSKEEAESSAIKGNPSFPLILSNIGVSSDEIKTMLGMTQSL